MRFRMLQALHSEEASEQDFRESERVENWTMERDSPLSDGSGASVKVRPTLSSFQAPFSRLRRAARQSSLR